MALPSVRVEDANKAVDRIVRSLQVRKLLSNSNYDRGINRYNILGRRTRRNISYFGDHQGRVSWSWDGSARKL